MDSTDETLGQFGRQILSLQRHLTRDVEGDRVRSVSIQDLP
jgi:hypothetical protein